MSQATSTSPHEKAWIGLRNSELRMGRGGLLQRPGFSNPPEFYRVRRGEHFELTLKWPKAPATAGCAIRTDLGEKAGAPFQTHLLRKTDSQTFVFRQAVPHPGVFSFQIRYTEDETIWHREPRPYARVMVQPESVENLCLYTLVPRISGPITGWGEHLRRARDMGCNAVHVLPVTRLCRSRSPYSATDLFSVEPAYTDPHDPRTPRGQFEAFVEQARELRMRLCLDLVVNHIGLHSDLVRTRPDWVCADDQEPDGLKRAGFWAGKEWMKWQDLVLIDHELPDPQQRQELWNHLIEYARLWAGYASATGGLIRLDNAHSTPEPFLGHLLKELRHQYPDLGILAELFCDLNIAQRLIWEHGIHLLLATPWEIPFVPQLREYLTFLHTQHPRLQYLMPISSADSGSPAQEFGSAASTVPRYALSALLGTGCTGLVQGVEFGVSRRVEFIGDPVPPPYTSQPDFRAALTEMNRIRTLSDAFRTGGDLEFVDADHHAVIAALRNEPNSQVQYLIAANFDTQSGHEVNIRHASIKQARIEDLADGQPVTADGDVLRLSLQPCQARGLKITPQ